MSDVIATFRPMMNQSMLPPAATGTRRSRSHVEGPSAVDEEKFVTGVMAGKEARQCSSKNAGDRMCMNYAECAQLLRGVPRDAHP